MPLVRETERVARIVEATLRGLVIDGEQASWDVSMTETTLEGEGVALPAVLVWLGVACDDEPTSMHTGQWHMAPGCEEDEVAEEVRDTWEELTFRRLVRSVGSGT